MTRAPDRGRLARAPARHDRDAAGADREVLDQRAVGQQAVVEHDDGQVAQRPLQRAGEVVLVGAVAHQGGPLQTPSKLCAIKSTKISQIG